MADTHESVRNLNEMLRSLAERQQREGMQTQEADFKNRQLMQQSQEMSENRKARAAQMAELIAGRKQAAFMPFQEKMLNEEMKMHPKWNLQQQTQDMLARMKPEYRDLSAFSYDDKFQPPQENAPGAGQAGQGGPGMDTMRALGIPPIPTDVEAAQAEQLTPFAKYGGQGASEGGMAMRAKLLGSMLSKYNQAPGQVFGPPGPQPQELAEFKP